MKQKQGKRKPLSGKTVLLIYLLGLVLKFSSCLEETGTVCEVGNLPGADTTKTNNIPSSQASLLPTS